MDFVTAIKMHVGQVIPLRRIFYLADAVLPLLKALQLHVHVQVALRDSYMQLPRGEPGETMPLLY